MKPIAILDRVIIKPNEDKQTTDSGIYLAEAKEQFKGEVVSVGCDVAQVQVGCIVHYSPKQFIDRDGYKVLNEKDILFVEGWCQIIMQADQLI